MDSHTDSVKNSCTDIYYLIIKWVFFFIFEHLWNEQADLKVYFKDSNTCLPILHWV